MITSVTYTQTGDAEFTFYFASDLSDPTFYIWLNGEFVTDTKDTYYKATVPFGEQVQFDVFDDPDEVPAAYYPPYATLRWEGSGAPESFRVEQEIDAVWVLQAIVPSRLTNLYHWKSRKLDDATTHNFRVIPIDTEGRQGTIREFSIEMCRYPDAPSQDMTFVAGEVSLT